MAEQLCMVEAFDALNAGDRSARRYFRDKLDSTYEVRPGQMGELVECDRCLSAFRLKAGGVYLETEPDCHEPAGQGLERGSYVLNIDYGNL